MANIHPVHPIAFRGARALSNSTVYTVDVSGANAQTYTATADYNPTDNEANKCGQFVLDARGTRTSTPYTDCWTRTR